MPAAGRDRVVVLASLGVIALAVLVAAFFAGTRVGSAARAAPAITRAAPAASRTRTAVATPTATPTPTKGPIAAGTHPWQALLGGECLEPYTSPWQTTYAVVACTSSHTAQMTRRVHLKGDGFPGSAAMIATLSLACPGAKSVDLDAAKHYDDIRIAYSYPTSAQWTAGDEYGYCFVSRTGDHRMKRSVAP